MIEKTLFILAFSLISWVHDAAFASPIGSFAEPDSQDDLYQQGTNALDAQRWEEAVEKFTGVVKRGGNRVDAALYWKAYAQNQQGRRTEALATLAELSKGFAGSRWVNDARALEVEIRQAAGQPVSPEGQADEELKLIAINSLMQGNAEVAVPMLEKLLQSNQSPKLKERTLFVLSQNGSPRAREVVAQIARGSASPDLQQKALHYLGLFGGKESRQTLAEIYASSTVTQVKKEILHSFMLAGDRPRVLAAAKSETVAELRGHAIHQLGIMGAQAELWELYQAESSVEMKEKILHSLFLGGNSEKLFDVARNDKDPKLRRAAIHSLGLMGSQKTGDGLLSLYESDKDPSVRKQILHGFFIQSNAKALVGLARKETDQAMKKEIVGKLSLMRSKEATDYLLEILNK